MFHVEKIALFYRSIVKLHNSPNIHPPPPKKNHLRMVLRQGANVNDVLKFGQSYMYGGSYM